MYKFILEDKTVTALQIPEFVSEEWGRNGKTKKTSDSSFLCGIHPAMVYHIKIDTCCPPAQQMLLV
jgi:hypothetical protein